MEGIPQLSNVCGVNLGGGPTVAFIEKNKSRVSRYTTDFPPNADERVHAFMFQKDMELLKAYLQALAGITKMYVFNTWYHKTDFVAAWKPALQKMHSYMVRLTAYDVNAEKAAVVAGEIAAMCAYLGTTITPRALGPYSSLMRLSSLAVDFEGRYLPEFKKEKSIPNT